MDKRGENYPRNPLFISTADVFDIPAKKELRRQRKSKYNESHNYSRITNRENRLQEKRRNISKDVNSVLTNVHNAFIICVDVHPPIGVQYFIPQYIRFHPVISSGHKSILIFRVEIFDL
jgi:hypothetical protein